MSANALQEWFAFGVFASWTSALLVSQLISPSSGRWGGEEAVKLTPMFALFFAIISTAPLYVRTISARHRLYRRRFLLPLFFGLLHAPLFGGSMWLAAVIRPAINLDGVLIVAVLGWPILLGEIVYRACRMA